MICNKGCGFSFNGVFKVVQLDKKSYLIEKISKYVYFFMKINYY